MWEVIRNIQKDIKKDVVLLLFLYGILILLEDGISAIFRFVALQLAQRTWKSAVIVCCICVMTGVIIYKLVEFFLVLSWFLLLRLFVVLCATGYGVQQTVFPAVKEVIQITAFGTGSKDYCVFSNAAVGCAVVTFVISLLWRANGKKTPILTVNRTMARFSRRSCRLSDSRSLLRRTSRRVSVYSAAEDSEDTPRSQASGVETLTDRDEVFLAEEQESETPRSDCCATCCFLMEELNQEMDSKLCVVCQNAPKSIILLPCAHVCVCPKCRESLLEKSCTCPICRKYINDTMHVYL